MEVNYVSINEKFGKMAKGFTLDQAIGEASRCLLCHDAPCSKACPAETDPAGFIKKLHLRNITGAIRTIKTNNILGGICGVLCPASRLCEKECSATQITRPIEIAKIQRALIEHSWAADFNVFEKPDQNKEKVAIIGAGPAGLTCAAELAKNGYKPTIFEAQKEPGGALRYAIPSYRLDKNFLKKEIEEIESLGVEIKCNSPIKDESEAENLLKSGYKAIFIGTGLWAAKSLNQDLKNISCLYSSVDFLQKLREEQFDDIDSIKNKTVAVIGGGSVAMDCAESALKLGAKDVYIIYRRSYLQMPAEDYEKKACLESGIHFLILNQPVDYIIDNNSVKGLKLIRTELKEIDASGRKAPKEIENSEWTLNADIIIEAIGNKPEDNLNKLYPNVKISEQNLIKADSDQKTSAPGIFAGGDIVSGPALVVTAVNDGKLAAKAIIKYLSK
jgi:glutamate synthase (NADPH) small chain